MSVDPDRQECKDHAQNHDHDPAKRRYPHPGRLFSLPWIRVRVGRVVRRGADLLKVLRAVVSSVDVDIAGYLSAVVNGDIVEAIQNVVLSTGLRRSTITVSKVIDDILTGVVIFEWPTCFAHLYTRLSAPISCTTAVLVYGRIVIQTVHRIQKQCIPVGLRLYRLHLVHMARTYL